MMSVLGLVLSQPRGLDDPQLSHDRSGLEPSGEYAQRTFEVCGFGPATESNDHQARVVFRREHERVAEIEIEGHETAALGMADPREVLVAGPAQILTRHRSHVVPGRSQDLGTSPSEVLVELQLYQDATACTVT